jgi:hypothetical protein
MTPADRRISELIDKWLMSIELHLKYAELSDSAYANTQTWPKHDRPTRWVLEVAKQKILELKAHCETRQAMNDSKFSESLELMAFLANLVGIQHIQRFIPLAEVRKQDTTTNETVESPTAQRPLPARARSAGDEATREMPKLRVAASPRAAGPVAPAKPATPTSKPAAKTSAPAKSAPSKSPQKPAPSDLNGKIVADAVRLMKWGKPWHELAELIARIAERPPAAEIRKVLRTHKNEIEEKAASS